VQNPDGSLKSNTVNFTVTASGESSNTLSINGLDTPSSLPLGTSGTWTVHATAGSGSGTLHYTVLWGDEVYAKDTMGLVMAPEPRPVQTSGSFTHVYQRSGTYTPTFTVTDDAGHRATTSATITVTPLY
jgi:hypothetical protein